MTVKRVTQSVLILVILLTMAAYTSDVQASSVCGYTYIVQRGDWLAKIARNCGVTLSELYAANPWTRYERYIYPGQALNIPGAYVPDVPYCGPGYDYYGSYYIVCRGDTLGRIARLYGVSINYLQWRNGIPNANLIYSGQFLRPY